MKVAKTIPELEAILNPHKLQNSTVGFVPTMGALHQGHLSLISQSKIENNVTVCSIFINPKQFNEAKDYENYPIDTENDIKQLEDVNCDVVFIPSVDEIYSSVYSGDIKVELNGLAITMEGEHRPGHFDGVVAVVHRLFDIVKPTVAYFGQKDYQQFMIIQKMSRLLHPNVKIIMCPTIREQDGLAMSSRNRLLSSINRQKAPILHQILTNAQNKYAHLEPYEIKQELVKELNKHKEFTMDYIEIANKDTLEPLNYWEENSEAQIFIASFIGGVRLIDNIKLVRRR